jgi:CheY-like chemotaxis protein
MMKSAMLLEYDEVTRGQIAGLLNSLGYIVAFAQSPQAGLHAAQALRFDAILTCTDTDADDRRSFIGELARLAPHAAIVFLLDGEAAGSGAHGRGALLFKPATLQSLRRVLDFGVDGLGMRHASLPPGLERRRLLLRRGCAR